MALTTVITVNALLAALVVFTIVWLHAHGIRHDRRHAQGHLRLQQAVEPAREQDRMTVSSASEAEVAIAAAAG
jgi:hypothetical protein